MAYQAGEAYVAVTPNLQGFQSDIEENLDGLDALFARAGESAGAAFSDAFTAKLREALADLPTAKVDTEADTEGLTADIDEATRDRKTEVEVDADTTPARAKLDELTKKSWTVKVKAQLDKVDDKLPGNGATLLGLGAVGIAPQAAGLAAGVAGVGVSFAAAAADAGAFGVIAKGMFSDVTAAQKALTTAQAAYAKADNSKDRAKALQDEAAATAKLTPAEKDLLTELTSLEGAWKKLSQAEQPAVGAAIAPWLQTATGGMKLLSPLITDGANAIELLGNEADSAIKSPFWTTFSTTLGKTGEEAIEVFGESVGKVGDGLAHLFVAFAPDIDNVLPDVEKIATAFDHWASSVSDKGLDDFLTKTFSPANIKALAADGKDLATFVENVAKASGEMSPEAFLGLGNVLDLMGHLTPDEILALTGLFLAIKGISAAVGAINAVSSFINGAKTAVGAVKGLFGGAETAAESATEGTAAGDAGGTAAATAFTTTFSTEVTAALPGIFTAIGTEGGTEAATAGTAMGTAAATAFGTAFSAEDALGVTAGLTAVGTEASVEAGVAGTAIGTAMATAFTASFDSEGVAEIGTSLAAAGVGAAIAAAIAGAVIGAALGAGFTAGLAATGVSGAAGKIESDVKAAASGANTWLTPAGQQAVQGFDAGFLSQEGAAKAAAAQLKGWAQTGGNGASTWLNPSGQQASQGFGTGFTSQKSNLDPKFAELKTWVTGALPSPLSWLVNIGLSVAQGFANGLASGASLVINEAESIASQIKSIVSGALTASEGSLGSVTAGHAAGTSNAPPGWAWVGERGPELMHFAGGEQVLSHQASLSALSGMARAQSLSALGVPQAAASGSLPGVSAPLGTGAAQLRVSYAGTGNQLTDALVGELRFDIQQQAGGDVQAHLGHL